MSWFNHVSQQQQQQQQQQPTDRHPDMLCSTHNSSRLTGPTEGSPTMVTTTPQHIWTTGCSTPSQEDFPSAPVVVSPPSLENLSCASPGAGSRVMMREPEPISYVSLQEQRCVLSWFQGWNNSQRERFLQDLLGKAVPGKVCTLLDSLSTLQVKDGLPNIYECQLRLWSQWFESWGEEERNHFLHILEERDPVFVAHFYRSVASTAGRD